ncbi:MAG: hypothetical protein MMC23_010029 [Stictis urceolatum]|nr:hypothetical protein [Stictis urceolata]
MEGARVWDRRENTERELTDAIWADVRNLPTNTLSVEDTCPTADARSNTRQSCHTAAEVEALATHLKRSLEDVVVTIFSAAQSATSTSPTNQYLQMRWVDAYFPFTSPSWELEVFWEDQWLEILGCGIVQQPILNGAGAASKLGWAFGLGLERIAMLLYGIPDIRLFWSKDTRFLSQFEKGKPPQRFMPFSKHPPCWKDVSFWLPNAERSLSFDQFDASAAVGTSHDQHTSQIELFHENNVMELVREVAGDLVEDMSLVDDFRHPETHRRSMCYRINYRSLERTLRNDEINDLHRAVCETLQIKLGVELR